jgi:hypothetical protein
MLVSELKLLKEFVVENWSLKQNYGNLSLE